MKKSLWIFIVCVLLLVFTKVVYTSYCKLNPIECKKYFGEEREMDYEKDGLPIEGVDW